MTELRERSSDLGLPRRLLASALAGASTGARSFTALGALVVATRPNASTQPDKLLAHPATKVVVALAAVQELVMDKLPKTPSRTETLGLATRMVGAAGSGVVIARRTPEDDLLLDRAFDRDAQPVSDEPGDPVGEVEPNAGTVVAVAAGCALVSVAAAVGTTVLGVRFRTWAGNHAPDWLGAGAEDVVTVALATAAARLSS